MQPVMLLHGENSVLIKAEINKHIKKYLPQGEQDINYVRFDMTATPVQTALSEASISPFMSDHRLIIADNAIFFTGSISKINHDLDALAAYLEKPNPDNILIFIINSNKLDNRKRITKLLTKQKLIYKFNELTDSQLETWTKNELAKYNSSMANQEALDTLLALADKKMERIEHEIKKLVEYCQQRPITKQDILLLVSRSLEDNVFNLIDELLNGNYTVTLDTIDDLLTNGESIHVIVALFASKLRTILICRQLLDDGHNDYSIAQQLGKNFWIQKSVTQARKLPTIVIANALIILAQADHMLKNSSVSNSLIIEKFALDLIKMIEKTPRNR